MERASSAVNLKPKILPIVLLSSIPIRLVNGAGGKEERKKNIRQNRTQPYTTIVNDNQRSLSERNTSCSNCNKQTNNQSSSSKGSNTLAGMLQSPMLILPILSTKSAISQAKIHSNVYCNQQQHHKTVYYSAAKKEEESNGGSCRVREISCSFWAHKLYFFSLLLLVCSLSLFLVLHPFST